MSNSRLVQELASKFRFVAFNGYGLRARRLQRGRPDTNGQTGQAQKPSAPAYIAIFSMVQCRESDAFQCHESMLAALLRFRVSGIAVHKMISAPAATAAKNKNPA
jgi:hypothetical protein